MIHKASSTTTYMPSLLIIAPCSGGTYSQRQRKTNSIVSPHHRDSSKLISNLRIVPTKFTRTPRVISAVPTGTGRVMRIIQRCKLRHNDSRIHSREMSRFILSVYGACCATGLLMIVHGHFQGHCFVNWNIQREESSLHRFARAYLLLSSCSRTRRTPSQISARIRPGGSDVRRGCQPTGREFFK